MRVIAKGTLREYWLRHADSRDALATWYRVAKKAKWQNLIDVQKTYAYAEAVDDFTVFNIKGNTYRLIVKIEYKLQVIYIHRVLTHAEYDKDAWK